MNTTPLYYQDAKLLAFESTVLNIDKNRCHLVLAETAFYPEGGGQPADIGSIEGIDVIDVKKENGVIIHFLAEPLPEKVVSVKGLVDESRRRDFMQQHTGQHLLSGCLHQLFDRDTVSVHLGEEYASIEVAEDHFLTEDELALLEDRANDYICENREIRSFNVKEADIATYNLRRSTKVKGKIRLVEIVGSDLVACGGVHCSTTGEVKFIKILNQESIRGNLRIFFCIGDRARRDYRMKQQICRTLASDLSVPVAKIPEQWLARQEEIQNLKISLQDWKIREATLFIAMLVNNAGEAPIAFHWDEGDGDYMKLIAKLLLEQEKPFCLTMISRGKLQWAIGCVANNGFPFTESRSHLLEPIEGKGGGKAPLWQGMGNNISGREEFQNRFNLLALSS
jgi:alanyl-tRNA synthetase